LHSYTQSSKTKRQLKEEQIIEMKKFIGDADEKIKAEHQLHHN